MYRRCCNICLFFADSDAVILTFSAATGQNCNELAGFRGILCKFKQNSPRSGCADRRAEHGFACWESAKFRTGECDSIPPEAVFSTQLPSSGASSPLRRRVRGRVMRAEKLGSGNAVQSGSTPLRTAPVGGSARSGRKLRDLGVNVKRVLKWPCYQFDYKGKLLVPSWDRVQNHS